LNNYYVVELFFFRPRVLSVLAFLKLATSYECFKPESNGRCCFKPDGKDLRNAVEDYYYGRAKSQAAKTYGTDIGDWCVDHVQDFSKAFFELYHFNASLTDWNTSSALRMTGIFHRALEFNQPVPFDTSRVTHMTDMFKSAREFNQPVNFNTSQETTMAFMFWNTDVFNQPLNSFDTRKVTDMDHMFEHTYQFNQPLKFDMSKVKYMKSMFSYAKVFNQDVSAFIKVRRQELDMTSMFTGAQSFSQNLTAWSRFIDGTTKVAHMFQGTSCPKKIDPILHKHPPSPGPFCYPV
jgi:hypothetical protein